MEELAKLKIVSLQIRINKKRVNRGVTVLLSFDL